MPGSRAKLPHLTIPVTTRSKEGGFDHEVDIHVKLTLKGLLFVAVVLHLVSVPVSTLIDYLTSTAGAATNLLP